MKCCKNCFWDGELKHLIQSKSILTGDCDFCGSHGEVIDPDVLRDQFEFVKEELFEPTDEGSPLAECFST